MSTEVISITMTPSDNRLVKALLRDDTQVDVIIPENIDAPQFWQSLAAVSKALAHTDYTQAKLIPVLGRLLDVANKHKELYIDAGYESYDDFIDRAIGRAYRVSRSTCYEARRLTERWGDRTVGLFAEVGRVKMNLLTKAVAKGDEGKGYCKKLIDKAKELTVEEFRDHLDKLEPANGQVERSTTIPEKIIITTNKKRAKKIRDFFESPEVHAYCESGQWDVILDRMCEECAGDWLRQVVEQQEGTGVTQ